MSFQIQIQDSFPLVQNLTGTLTKQNEHTLEEVIKTTNEYKKFVDVTQKTIDEQSCEILFLTRKVEKLKSKIAKKEKSYKANLKTKDQQISIVKKILDKNITYPATVRFEPFKLYKKRSVRVNPEAVQPLIDQFSAPPKSERSKVQKDSGRTFSDHPSSDLAQTLLSALTQQYQSNLDDIAETTKELTKHIAETKKTISEQSKEIAALRVYVKQLEAQKKLGKQANKSVLKAKDRQYKTITSILDSNIIYRVSDIRQQVNINDYGGVCGQLAVYNINHNDGTSTQVVRVWRVHHRATEFRPGLSNTSVIEAVPDHLMEPLKTMIAHWENNVGNQVFPNPNIDLCGARLGNF